MSELHHKIAGLPTMAYSIEFIGPYSSLWSREVSIRDVKITGASKSEELISRTSASSVIQELEASLLDPGCVHVNMLRGGIAKPSWNNILHIYPDKRDEISKMSQALEKISNSPHVPEELKMLAREAQME